MIPEIEKVKLVLKSALKTSGMRYIDLARKLRVSEATVKRTLNGEDLSLKKLAEVCEKLELDLFSVMERASMLEDGTHYFTYEQERVLASNFQLFLFFRLLVLNRPVEDIMKELALDEKACREILRKFEDCGLIELHPGDKIKLLAKFPYKWSEEGPLHKKYTKHLLERVVEEIETVGINNERRGVEKTCLVTELALGPESGASFQEELEAVFHKYKVLSKMEMKALGRERKIFSGMILAGEFSWWSK